LASRKELDKNRKDLNRKPHLDTGLSEFWVTAENPIKAEAAKMY
jgi:hypothetical protein